MFTMNSYAHTNKKYAVSVFDVTIDHIFRVLFFLLSSAVPLIEAIAAIALIYIGTAFMHADKKRTVGGKNCYRNRGQMDTTMLEHLMGRCEKLNFMSNIFYFPI